ncbi:uncharacterized protein LOC123263663 [Cotesia glomerata]|uniref:Uncharacterized protein n=1 Tax=Cotesia glomerata TaxID=32391 RepID=A0AAV7INF8_COTGL|nr:uncharacterized protein LOC123263663 [Cotesia glomerata]KAH0554682.1 hypothetical protein KQX54_012262 [Cotesia glomerata]
MCKLFLISLILTSSLSLSFSTNNSNCEEKKDLYELKLSAFDPDVSKFVQDGWEKLVAERKTRGATNKGGYSIDCARVQVADTERRYTILVNYETDLFGKMLSCIIFVMTTQTEPLRIICNLENIADDYHPAERELRNLFNFFYNSKLYCS